MPHQTTWSADGCHAKVFGEITAAELHQISEELYGSPNFDDIEYFVRDVTGVTKVCFDEVNVEIFAYVHTAAIRHKKHLRGAYVIGNSPIEHLVQKFIHELKSAGSKWEVRCFKDMEPAMKWLKTCEQSTLNQR